MISKITIKKALGRGLNGFIVGAIGAFALMVIPNFQSFGDIKAWLMPTLFALIVGGLTGLQKAWSGYNKYDK